MTQEHLTALLAAGDAAKSGEWLTLPDARSLTLYIAGGGATLSIGRVQSVRQEGPLVHAKTNKGEHYVVALADAYAGSVDAPSGTAKKAGFL
ncbi:MAG TPA: hypothetical protein VGQ57_19685 [Polyangiaceae bacterium]|jgi:hypothetical protein|nr:hypothetical protein [Polyangiaceae bacterium]